MWDHADVGATGERCRSCGATLAPEARFCSRCGHRRGEAAAPTLVDLSPLTPPVAPAEQRAVVATRPPARRRTLAVVAALVALAVVAFGVAELLDDEDGDASADPAPTSTTEPGDAPSSTSEVTTSSTTPTTSTTSTSAVPTTTSAPYVNQQRGLVLDESQRGRSLYLVAGSTIFRAELDTGRVTSRGGLGGLTGGQVVVHDGRVFLPGANLSSIATDLAGDVTFLLAPPGYTVLHPVSFADGSTWFVRYDAEGTRLRRLDADGRTLDEQLVDRGLYLAGVLGDRVVVSQGGRLWLFGPGDRRVPYARGILAARSDRFLLWLGCDDAARCTYRLGDAATADTGRTSLESSYVMAGGDAGGLGSTLAPDGATILAWRSINNGRPQLVDLATGSLLDLPDSSFMTFGWSPDGRWLVMVNGAIVNAIDVRTGATRVLAIPGHTGASPVAVAIG